MQRSFASGAARRPAREVDGEFAPQHDGVVADRVRLATAADGLACRTPELSASAGLWPWQRGALIGLSASILAGVVWEPEATLIALLAVLAVPFLCVVTLRALALWNLVDPPEARRPPPHVGDAIDDFPLYTVLVPLYREAGVVPHLLRALARLDYPANRLEIMLIVERVDAETRAALYAADLPARMRVIVVPDGEPRTKPRACQYALQFARGAYVVVYDAEDLPDRDQLKRALAALRAEPHELGCLQAQLNIYNSNASWLTRQFTIEYTALFDAILPTLERLDLPVPLGGTSNHFPGIA